MNNYYKDKRKSRYESNVSGIKCNICEKNTVVPKVQIIYRGRVSGEFYSAIEAENHSSDNMLYPCIIRFVYECKGCRKSDIKLERVYNGI